MLAHQVDLGVGLRAPVDKRLVQIPLGSEPYEVFVHTSSELAKRHEITLEELTEHALVMYPKGYLGRDLVDDVCREQGLELSTVMEVGSASSCCSWLRQASVPHQPRELLKQHSGWSDIVSIPIAGPVPVRHMELTYYADRFISKAQQQLMEWLIDFLNPE